MPENGRKMCTSCSGSLRILRFPSHFAVKKREFNRKDAKKCKGAQSAVPCRLRHILSNFDFHHVGRETYVRVTLDVLEPHQDLIIAGIDTTSPSAIPIKNPAVPLRESRLPGPHGELRFFAAPIRGSPHNF